MILHYLAVLSNVLNNYTLNYNMILHYFAVLSNVSNNYTLTYNMILHYLAVLSNVLNNYTHLQYDITLLSSSIKCFK